MPLRTGRQAICLLRFPVTFLVSEKFLVANSYFVVQNREKDQERCQTLLAIDDRHDLPKLPVVQRLRKWCRES